MNDDTEARLRATLHSTANAIDPSDTEAGLSDLSHRLERGTPTGARPRRPSSRTLAAAAVLTVVGLATAALVVATGDGRDNRPTTVSTAGPRSVRVDVTELTGVAGAHEVVATGDRLFAASWPWTETQFSWSDDKGLTWKPSKVPDHEERGDDVAVITAGELLFVNFIGSPQGPGPLLWVSDDGGRTFSDTSGFSDTATGQASMSIVEHAGQLVAVRADPQQQLQLWSSPDQGRTWIFAPANQGRGLYPKSVISHGDVLVMAAMNSSGDRQIPTPGLFISTDRWASWSAVALDGWDRQASDPVGTVEVVEVVGDLMVAASESQTFASSDGGTTWRLLGNPSGQGEMPARVAVLAADGDLLVGAWPVGYEDAVEPHPLLFSEDGGQTWNDADIDVDCSDAYETTSVRHVTELDDALVTTWSCVDGAEHGSHLLTSLDGGRTWKSSPGGRFADLTYLAEPVVVGSSLITFASRNIEQSLDVRVQVTVDGGAPVVTSTSAAESPAPEPTDREVEINDGDPGDPASAITVTVDVEQLVVAPGESFAVEVTMTNETGATLDLRGCPFGGAEWSAIGTDGTEFFGGSQAVDCGAEAYPWADGEVRTETFDFAGRGSKPLSEGSFTARIKFFNPDVTITVPGTVKG